jgi:branched-chain amino acid aminotransferase
MAPDTSASLAKIGGQYVNSQFAKMEAVELGFSEAIVLDINGNVSEGSGENIFVMSDGVIYTTPIGSSILSGITRDSAITIARDLGYEVREQTISRDMLYIADEIFFTGTAAEVTPVRSVDKIQIGKGSRGPITKAIQERFFAIVSGNTPDKYNWLTPVSIHEPASHS